MMYRKDWIGKWAEYSPQKTAIIACETGESISYLALNEHALRVAYWLITKQGLQKGDRVMVLAEHGIPYVVLFSVMQKTGIILVPVNYRLAVDEIKYLVDNSTPKMLIAEKIFEEKAKAIAQELPLYWMEDIEQKGKDTSLSTDFTSVEIEENEPAFILYTSGTTGFPKGAIYSHKMLFWNSVNTSQSLELTPQDHTISCMPPFHTGGWNVLLTPLLHRGGSIGIMKKFDANWLLQLMEEQEVSLFMGVPTMLKMMAASPTFHDLTLEKLRYFIVGGEALPVEVIRLWHNKGIKIRQGYGLTEVGPNLTSLHQDDAERKIGSIGKPNFYVDYQLLDDDNQSVSNGKIGEFCLKGPMVTPGYWQNDEATAKSLQNDYFYTGDLVKQDEEGFLYVVDRKKSMFISGGENVYPAEIERMVRTYDAIDEAALVGVPDDKWGEVGKLFITVIPSYTFDEKAFKTFCMEKMAKFKVPKYVEILREMPKNDSGKIDRKLLTQKARNHATTNP